MDNMLAFTLGLPGVIDYPLTLLLFAAIGFAAGISSIISGGMPSLITIPSFIALGLPPHVALGVHKVAGPGFHVGGLIELYRTRNIDWELVPHLTVFGVLAALAGTYAISHVDPGQLRWLIVCGIAVGAVFTFYDPARGVEPTAVTRSQKWFGFGLYFVVIAWSSTITIGVGIFMLYIYLFLFGRTMNQAKGTNRIPAIVQNIVSIIVFWQLGYVIWDLGLATLIGQFFGARAAIRKGLKEGNQWLKNIFVIAAVPISILAVFAAQLR